MVWIIEGRGDKKPKAQCRHSQRKGRKIRDGEKVGIEGVLCKSEEQKKGEGLTLLIPSTKRYKKSLYIKIQTHYKDIPNHGKRTCSFIPNILYWLRDRRS